MKMLRITEGGYIGFFFFTHTDLNYLFHKLQTALKYETKMFQMFITCSSDNSYISYMGLYKCFIFLRLTLFCKALLDPVFPVIAVQRFDFKNSIIAIQLFLMILNLYVSSA